MFSNLLRIILIHFNFIDFSEIAEILNFVSETGVQFDKSFKQVVLVYFTKFRHTRCALQCFRGVISDIDEGAFLLEEKGIFDGYARD